MDWMQVLVFVSMIFCCTLIIIVSISMIVALKMKGFANETSKRLDYLNDRHQNHLAASNTRHEAVSARLDGLYTLLIDKVYGIKK